MKKLIFLALILISFLAKAQVPAINDTTRYGTNLPQFFPQWNYGNFNGYRLLYEYNSITGKTDLYPTAKYLRAFYPSFAGNNTYAGSNTFNGSVFLTSFGTLSNFNNYPVFYNSSGQIVSPNWNYSYIPGSLDKFDLGATQLRLGNYITGTPGTSQVVVSGPGGVLGTIPANSYINNGTSAINQNYNLGTGTAQAYSFNGMTINSGDSTIRNIVLSNALNFMPSFGGKDNIGFGSDVFSSMHTSSKNIGIGTRVLQYYNGSSPGDGGSGGYMLGIGYEALANATTAIADVLVGTWAGNGITTSQGIAGFGYNSLIKLTTGNDNSAFGTESAEQLAGSSRNNTAIGAQAMYGNLNTITPFYANGTTAVGWNALSFLYGTSGSPSAGNIAIGHASGANIKTGLYNIIIGANVGATDSTVSNTLNIGNMIWAKGIYGSVTTGTGPHGITPVTNNTPVTNGSAGVYSPFYAPSLFQTSWSNGTALTDSLVTRYNGGYRSIPANSYAAAGGGTLTYSHINGNGILGSAFNNTANQTWSLDTASVAVTKTFAGKYITAASTNALTNKDLTSGTNTFPTFNQNTTGSAAKWTTPRTLSITGDLAYTSPSLDGSGNVTAAGTLATVNSNVGSFGSSTAIPSFTVNAKGLITAASTNAVIAPAGTLTGTTLASNVTGSSLTSFGSSPTLITPFFSGWTNGVSGTDSLVVRENGGIKAIPATRYLLVSAGSSYLLTNTLYGTANASTGIGYRFDATSFGGKIWGFGDGTTTNGTFAIRDISDSKDVLSIVGSSGAATFINSVTSTGYNISGASNDLLTANGGHVAQSTFATASAYLPLVAGSGNPLTGDLYVNGTGTSTTTARLHTATTGYYTNFISSETGHGDLIVDINGNSTANQFFKFRFNGADVGNISGAGTLALNGLIYSTSSTPTIVLGAAGVVGTGATYSIVGNNQDGMITINTGTGAGGSGTAFTFTMGGSFAYPNSCLPVTQPSTNGSSQVQLSINSQTSTGFVVHVGELGSGLASSTTYRWNYHNGGY